MNDILGEINEMCDAALEVADHETLGQKLQKSRTELGLKLVDISRVTGLSESLIGKIESDKIDDIKISTMKKLSLAYELPVKLFIDHLGVEESMDHISQKLTDMKLARLAIYPIASKAKELQTRVKLFETKIPKLGDGVVFTRVHNISLFTYSLKFKNGGLVKCQQDLMMVLKNQAKDLKLDLNWLSEDCFTIKPL